ncbi:hypothetical protein I545_6151 [Mycobacterium kansasii 662]|uniref:Uncharacterized protein n=2 Tax=Mycobacterium kansasii TaxID=1768 RepID=A0A1V3X3J1_MYCKA|nr:hypothetical protein I547_5724 [Mycobacterium kansasii 824]EUA09111.1 hypothetical protein I545_6151 [Mycobacterium kansasii 662]KEP41545.1 hypothetical protein MKSMC1_33180 [Mycobacterium kansasii]OOK73705.1 hypothetical protein BZL30_4751 [Mycobacterium kansasii]OOK76797.1 hypothetical protein BZL29_3984 [Mycobacterium kansasii]
MLKPGAGSLSPVIFPRDSTGGMVRCVTIDPGDSGNVPAGAATSRPEKKVAG